AWSGVRAAARLHLERAGAALDERAARARQRALAALGRAEERRELRSQRLQRDAIRALEVAQATLGRDTSRLARSPVAALTHAERAVDHVAARVRARDPALALARGWSITRGPDGRAVTDASLLRPGDLLETTLARGSVHSTVTAGPDATATAPPH